MNDSASHASPDPTIQATKCRPADAIGRLGALIDVIDAGMDAARLIRFAPRRRQPEPVRQGLEETKKPASLRCYEARHRDGRNRKRAERPPCDAFAWLLPTQNGETEEREENQS